MPKLVKNNLIVDSDGWTEVTSIEAFKATEKPLIPLSMLTSHLDDVLTTKTCGLLFNEDDDFDLLKEKLTDQPVIVFKFGKFADGRFFSFARELREQRGYTGDIRATGDFMPDQVAFLRRCGFTSFDCRTDAEAAIAPTLQSIISEAYQADVIHPDPLFRRK